MKYLVLRRFWSFGKLLEKGSVVDESEIRSPSLRRSEGKITPAVSSQQVPEEFGAEDTGSQAFEGNTDKAPDGAEGSAGGDETAGSMPEGKNPNGTNPEKPAEPVKPKLFSFGKS